MNKLKNTILWTIFVMLTILCCNVKAQTDISFSVSYDQIADTNVKEAIELNTSKLLTAIDIAFYEKSKPLFESINISQRAKNDILDIWIRLCKFNCGVPIIERRCIKRSYNGGYQVRGIPLTMDIEIEAEKHQELTINYNEKGQIDEIFLSKAEFLIDQIMNNTSMIDFNSKMILVDFVYKFLTAYKTKDIDFLDTVFSENALIISLVDNTINVKPNVEKTILIGKDQNYQIQTKNQYIKNLRRVFSNNEYISLAIDSLNIERHTKDNDIYGVSFKQFYKASNYQDTGYIFLLIDFANKNEPVIWIRGFQPEYYKGKKLQKEERFSVSTFNSIFKDRFR
jgi:hypothetical protein